MYRQPAAVFVIRLIAKQIEKLPLKDCVFQSCYYIEDGWVYYEAMEKEGSVGMYSLESGEKKTAYTFQNLHELYNGFNYYGNLLMQHTKNSPERCYDFYDPENGYRHLMSVDPKDLQAEILWLGRNHIYAMTRSDNIQSWLSVEECLAGKTEFHR